MSDPMTPEVREWMKRTDAEPPDAQRSARQVMTRLPEVRQRKRWWPFPVRYRPAKAPTTTNNAEYQTTPIPATNGQSATVTGRTQSMFSPAKALVAGALVFAVGGVLFVAQPFGQPGDSVPGAVTDAEPAAQSEEPTDPMRPRAASIDFGEYLSGSDGTRRADDPGVVHYEGDHSEFRWESSDPRLSGTVTTTGNRDIYQGAPVTVESVTLEVVNDGGRWSGPLTQGTVGSDSRGTAVLRGEGDYEGLSALIFLEWNSTPPTAFAAIFPGEMPPVPEPVSGE